MAPPSIHECGGKNSVNNLPISLHSKKILEGSRNDKRRARKSRKNYY